MTATIAPLAEVVMNLRGFVRCLRLLHGDHRCKPIRLSAHREFCARGSRLYCEALETRTSPAVAPFLDFPVEGYNAWNAVINSVYDHHLFGGVVEEVLSQNAYDTDGAVTAYTGETGDQPDNGGGLACFRQQNGMTFRLQGNQNPWSATSLCYDGHPAYDFGYRTQTLPNILASAVGTVTEAGWNDPNDHSYGCGQYVKLDHANGYFTLYCHMEEGSIAVTVNQVVASGDLLGKMGSTGNSTGPHLHFEVRRGNLANTRVSVDPYGWEGNNVLWNLAAPVGVDGTEPNGGFAGAFGPLNPQTNYSGAISSPSDMDYFRISLSAAGKITLNLDVPTNADYNFELFDANSMKIAESIKGTGVDESLSFDASAAGEYTVRVWGNQGSFSATSYTLSGNWPAPIVPMLTIGDVNLTEGNSGVTTFNFVATLSTPTDTDVTVDFATTDISAVSPTDYQLAAGILTIPAGQTSGMISVSVNGDVDPEGDELFQVILSNLSGAILGDVSAQARIFDDDGVSGPVVTDVNAVIPLKTITALQLVFDKDLDSLSASTLANYNLFAAGKDKRLGTADDAALPLVSAIYDSGTDSVTLTLLKALKQGQFVRIIAHDTITDTAGNALDGEFTGEFPSGDGVNGGDFITAQGFGSKFKYTDRNGDAVALALKGGGRMQLLLTAEGEGDTLHLSNILPGVTVLTGSVKLGKLAPPADGVTTIQHLTGSAGVINLLPVQFQIIYPPSSLEGDFVILSAKGT